MANASTYVLSYIRKFVLSLSHSDVQLGETWKMQRSAGRVVLCVCGVPGTVGAYSVAVVSHNTNKRHKKRIDCSTRTDVPRRLFEEAGGSLEQATKTQEFTEPLKSAALRKCFQFGTEWI